MALKDTLLAFSLGATMVAGTSADGKNEVATPRVPKAESTMSAAEVQRMKFRENYLHLWRTMDGAYFSFGDTKDLRQNLKEIASTPKGYEIISQLTKDTQISSARFIRGEAYYDYLTKDVEINTNILSDYTGKILLFHELLHGYQDQKGLYLKDKGVSFEQAVTAQKLIEAETLGWDKTNDLTGFLFAKMFEANPDHLNNMKQLDMDGVVKACVYDGRVKISPEQMSKYIQELKQFQTFFIQSGGKTPQDFYEAQKKMVGFYMTEAMKETDNPFVEWRDGDKSKNTRGYDKQAIKVAYGFAKNGNLTMHGNEKAFNKVLDYYVIQYHVKRDDINKMALGEKGKEFYKEQQAKIEQGGYLKEGYKKYSMIQLVKNSKMHQR